MPQFDLPIDQLRAYTPDLAVPDDLDAFWDRTMAEARSTELVATATPVETGLTAHLDPSTSRSRVRRDDGEGLAAPAAVPTDPLPAVVEFIGYGGGRGLPHERRHVVAGRLRPLRDGHARSGLHLVRRRDTPDPGPVGAPSHPGFMTRGILRPEPLLLPPGLRRWRSRGRGRPRPSGRRPPRVAVTGGSQGGGDQPRGRALVPDVAAVMPRTSRSWLTSRARRPWSTPIPTRRSRATSKAHRDHVEAASATLAYFDVAILGRRATAPALFSVGLMDEITPAIDRLRCVQPLRRSQGDRRVPVQRSRGRPGVPRHREIRWLAELFRP